MALARDIREAGEPADRPGSSSSAAAQSEAARRYLEFLKQGSRGYPLELLRSAGVDLSTSAPIDAALAEYAEQVEAMADLL